MIQNIKSVLKRSPLIVRLWNSRGRSVNLAKTLKIRTKNVRFRVQNKLQGGMPLPPPRLIFLVAGSEDLDWFLKSGALSASSMQDILKKNNLALENFESVLDFGCGVGRVIRYWHKMEGPVLFGTDYNPDWIAWCRRNLAFAHFQVNRLAGKLEYEDEKFDFIYALSVFTHLKEPQQFFWINELSRVLKPGGYLFITVHGERYYLPHLLSEDQERFIRGELVVYGGEQEGSNVCAAFHPDVYIRQKMAKDLLVVDHVPEGALGNPYQDVYLLRKPIPQAVPNNIA